ncbi:hypothetical protein M0R04_07950 [Candidatus Dojkabacteria bacterium]|nr:hypothetical protein [Candidatus Dojkabacteria bacterium]
MVLVGKNSSISTGGSRAEVETYTNTFKQLSYLDLSNSIYVKLLNGIKDGSIDKIPKDAMQYLSDNSEYSRPYKGSKFTEQDMESPDCGCDEEPVTYDDYLLGVDDNRYYVSNFARITFAMNNLPRFNLAKIRLVARWEDDIEYM